MKQTLHFSFMTNTVPSAKTKQNCKCCVANPEKADNTPQQAVTAVCCILQLLKQTEAAI